MGHSVVMDTSTTALLNNPAALGNYEYLTISAFASLKTLAQSSGHLESISDDGAVNTTALKAPLNMIVIYPAPRQPYEFMNLVYGMGYSRYFHWVNEHSWSLTQEGAEYSRELDGSPGVNVIHMGVGARLWQRVSLGMTVNFIPVGDYYSKDVLYVDGEYTEGVAETYTTSSTLFYNLGLQAKLTSGISVGATIKTPFDWGASEYWTSENTIPVEQPLFKSPLSVGYGFSYTKGLFRVQFEHITNNYSEMELDGLPIEVDDGVSNRLGIEYSRNISRFRFGYYTDDFPLAKSNETTPIPVSGFTFGYGYSLGKLNMDLAFDHSSWTNDAFMHPFFSSESIPEDKFSSNTFTLELYYIFTDGIPKF